MIDREKVIKGLENIVSDMQEEIDEWRDYSDSELSHGLTCDCEWWYNTAQMLKDALALLKAQDAELERLKNCGAECKIECLLDEYNKVVAERDALRKAQEPRVMTLEEVREKMPFVLWVEDLDARVQVFPVALVDGAYRDGAFDWCADVEIEQDDYGKRWRYWDKRPTNEKREATPWE